MASHFALPILISVPHAGLLVPQEVASRMMLSLHQIEKDGDEQADEIYDIGQYVNRFEKSQIARAVVDLNRSTDDRRPDGVVKTHTCWDEPVYQEPLPETIVDELLEKYYHPYHQALSDVDDALIKLCVDCHTMAAKGPPIGPDTGKARPHVCLGDDNGQTMPGRWMDQLYSCFKAEFGESVTVNQPFSGGYITQIHGQERPWVQVEISREEFASPAIKRERFLAAMKSFCERELT